MPLVRLQVNDVYGLGQPELHRNVDREDPKSILDGVAVSGLVGILRQLGDLTEFATEIFHGIQEEVMITASRSNKLKMRLKQIEATVPSIQKAVLAQTNHIHFAYTGGLEWHPRIPNVQNHFIYDDLPSFVMAPYEDCREPPRLHLLDKFDINGQGSCLKRYSDPTHFKTASKPSKLPEIKKKKSLQRNRDISSLGSMANQSDRSGGEKLNRVSTSSRFALGPRTIASVLSESESEDANDTLSQDLAAHGSSSISWHEKAEIVESNALHFATDEAPEVVEPNHVVDGETVSRQNEHTAVGAEPVTRVSEHAAEDAEPVTRVKEDSAVDTEPVTRVKEYSAVDAEPLTRVSEHAAVDAEPVTRVKKDLAVDTEPVTRVKEHSAVDSERVSRVNEHSAVNAKPVTRVIDHATFEAVQDIKPKYSEDESDSEGDDFVDALYTIDSESENDQAYKTTEEVQKKISNEITEERLDSFVCEQETEKISNNFSDDEAICAAASDLHLSPAVNKSDELYHRDQWDASEISNGSHSYSNGFSNPLYDISGLQEHHESEEYETSYDTESIKIWTNGNLLGLEPSKPKIIAETIPEIVEDNNAETFQEPLREDYEAPFDWFTSSPPLDHMKISFNPSETPPSSELEMKLPDDYTLSSFQLVPDTGSTSLPDSDSDKDTFCRSSSYISDNSDNRSMPMSEQHWEEESDEIHESTSQQEIYESFHNINAEAPLSDPSPKIETGNGCLARQFSYLQNPAEPLPPPLPPIQWRVSKTPSGKFEDNNKSSLKDALMRAFQQNNNSLSAVKKEEPKIVTASDPKPEIKVHLKNNVRDYKQSHGNVKETEAGDFLHQIRKKQFNLRRVVTTKISSSEATMNTNISVILEKANSIRQAVASDDGDGESDSWSDSD